MNTNKIDIKKVKYESEKPAEIMEMNTKKQKQKVENKTKKLEPKKKQKTEQIKVI